MSKPIEIHGFTPSFDVILTDPKLGPTAALVYGKVWRFCQMQEKACFAARDRMAEETGLAIGSYHKWLPKLVKAGYLEVANPECKTKTGCRYTTTGKLGLRIVVEATE